MVCSFWLYVQAEQAIDKTADQRLNAILAAGKMRHTTESLTKMVRTYILTGNAQYKEWYNELDDVRQGKVIEPANSYIWDLRVYGERRPLDAPISELSMEKYLLSVAKEDEYGRFLHEAWENLPALSAIERNAIALYETRGIDAAENKKEAYGLLFGAEYNEAKLKVMRPLLAFQSAATTRSMHAAASAKRWAKATRTSFMLLGLLCLLLAWRTYQSVRSVHGASVKELQEQIERLGHGDFATPVLPPDASNVDPNSLMAWLNQSRARLQEFDAARQTAEYELSDKNRDLAINNLVLQELTVGLPLAQLLDKFILAIESNHPGMLCSVLLANKDGTSLHHAAAPSLGASWAKATQNVRIGAGVGSCGTAACRQERILVEDVLHHPFWEDFKPAALESGIRSSWSQPIVDSHARIIGTFAIYQKFPALPTQQELRWMESFSKLAGYIIERSRMADALDETRYLYDLIAKNINDLIWVMDLPSMRLRYLSPSSSRVLGWAPEEFYENQRLAFSPDLQVELRERFMALYMRVKAGDTAAMHTTFESDLTHRSGQIVPVELSVKVTLGTHGEPATLIGVAREISERRKAEETILKMAFYDALTGLPNRRLLEDRLHQVLALAKRNSTKVSVLFIDLDRFKAVNDEHSHKMGDWLLTQVAARMTHVLRESDTAARVGGDEFVVLLPDSTTMTAAVAVAHKIRWQMDQPFVHDSGVRLSISCSIGVAMYPDQADNPRDLLHFGDEAMYQAKKDGRNAVVAFDHQWASANMDKPKMQKQMG